MTPKEIYAVLAEQPPVQFQELISHYSPDPNADNDGVGFGRGVKMRSTPDKEVWTDCKRERAFEFAEASINRVPGHSLASQRIRVKLYNQEINNLQSYLNETTKSILVSSPVSELDANRDQLRKVLSEALKKLT